ncbi:MAG TPA: NUDIX hydrolase, partial [Myxococcota bacterium]|nr:NUDIX hydrolase [Myxococcota bacterium]
DTAYSLLESARSEIQAALDAVATGPDDVLLNAAERALCHQALDEIIAAQGLLLAAGAQPDAPPTGDETRLRRKLEAHVIVTGTNARGERCVVLGRQRRVDGTPGEAFVLPGGHKAPTDPTFAATAARTLAEQTGLTGTELTEAVAFEHRGVSNDSLYRHHVYTLDLGDALAQLRFAPSGNWRHLELVPVSRLAARPVRRSHAAMVRAVDSGSRAALDQALIVEHDGLYLMRDAVSRGALASLETLHAEGVRPTSAEKTKLLEEAVLANQPEVAEWLLERGAEAREQALVACGQHPALLTRLLPRLAAFQCGFWLALLHDAAKRDEALGLALVDHLLAHPCDHDNPYHNAIVLAGAHNAWPRVAALLDADALRDYRPASYETDGLSATAERADAAGELAVRDRLRSLVAGRGPTL